MMTLTVKARDGESSHLVSALKDSGECICLIRTMTIGSQSGGSVQRYLNVDVEDEYLRVNVISQSTAAVCG